MGAGPSDGVGSSDGFGVSPSDGGASVPGWSGSVLGPGSVVAEGGAGDDDGTGGTSAGTPGSGVFVCGGAGVSPTVTGPRTDPVTGANPLRSGSSAARLQLTRRVPAFQESSVRLSQ